MDREVDPRVACPTRGIGRAHQCIHGHEENEDGGWVGQRALIWPI